MHHATLFLVEQSPVIRRELKARLLCYGVVQEVQAGDLQEYLNKYRVDLLILGSCKSLNPVDALRRNHPDLPVIFLATESSESLAIEAIHSGVNDYFKAPYDFDEIAGSVRRILQGRTARRVQTSAQLPRCFADQMVGNSVFIQEIRNCISQLAATSSNVLVTGETGTGKELVAQSIHRKSARAPKPFVCVNCAAIPDTLMESEFFGYERGAFTGAHASKQGKLALAQGGTVFFDEIGDMTTYMQAKILRAIEGKEIQPLGGRGNVPVDFRVIAATNQDLDRLVSEGKFRQDLYFRLNVGWIHVPPLRERKEDIPALIDYYIADMNVSFGRRVEKLDDGALEQLVRYSWPGNIRELRNVLEAAYVRLPSAQTSVLSLPQPFPRRLLNSLEGFSQSERDHLIAVLSATKWNKSATAQKLNWSRMTLYRKMAKYQITRCAVKKSSETRNGSDPGLASDVA